MPYSKSKKILHILNLYGIMNLRQNLIKQISTSVYFFIFLIKMHALIRILVQFVLNFVAEIGAMHFMCVKLRLCALF